MSRRHRFESPAVQHLYDTFIGDDKKLQEAFEEHSVNSRIARQIYDLRKGAGLTQGQLAEKIGSTASCISRLEDADYERHSLSMLRKIAAALGVVVEVNFKPRPSSEDDEDLLEGREPIRPMSAKLGRMPQNQPFTNAI